MFHTLIRSKCNSSTGQDAYLPAPDIAVYNPNGPAAFFHLTWDQYGKLASYQTPKGTTTTLAYNYSAFPLGRLMSVTEGSKTPVTFTYNEPSGLVKTVSYPTPGSSGGGSQSTISYTYDALGNMLTKTYPGPNGNITITCNYTSDGLFTQQEKLGLPLTVTDPQGNTTHLRYDSRGNLSTIIDPLGKEVDRFFNTAHQPTTIILLMKTQ
jgi:YD repeat-containing protein